MKILKFIIVIVNILIMSWIIYYCYNGFFKNGSNDKSITVLTVFLGLHLGINTIFAIICGAVNHHSLFAFQRKVLISLFVVCLIVFFTFFRL